MSDVAASTSAVACGVCPRACVLPDGATGVCGARLNRGGEVRAIGSRPGAMVLSSVALDPIEKKPISSFHPGSTVLSIGGYGCTMRCPFCQNHSIASTVPDEGLLGVSVGSWHTATEVAEAAASLEASGCIGVAYTYNEPMVFMEFMLETMEAVRALGLTNVVVTNGYATETAMREILGFADALNIDVKGFSQRVYDLLGAPGGFEAVRRSVEMAADTSHVEVTTLVVPGINDSLEEMAEEARWLASVDPSITLHITRFFPRHLMTGVEPTSVRLLYELGEVAGRYLSNVKIGNV